MDELYNDPANACLRWVITAYVASEKLAGRSAEEIDRRLEQMRRWVAKHACQP